MATIVSAFLSLSLFFLFLFLFTLCNAPASARKEPGAHHPLCLHPPVRALSSFWIKFHSVFSSSLACCILLLSAFSSYSFFQFPFPSRLFFFCGVSLSSLGFYFISFYWTFDCIFGRVRSFVCAACSRFSPSHFCWHCWLYSLFVSHFLWLAPLLCTSKIARDGDEEVHLYITYLTLFAYWQSATRVFRENINSPQHG